MEMHTFTPNVSPLENIGKALEIAHQYYGIKSASAAQDALNEARDPNSDISKAKQLDASSAFTQMANKGYIPKDSLAPMLDNLQKMPATSIDTMVKDSPLLNLTFHQMNADASVMKTQGLIGVKQGQLDETKNQNSIAAGQAFDQDPIIKASNMSRNSLNRSQSILNNPNKPVTTKDLNLAYNDYINAVSVGGAATDGKITRELPETWAQTFNDMKARSGEFDDLRQSPTGQKLIGMLQQNIGTVKDDLSKASADQAVNLYTNLGHSTNDKVKAVANEKLKAYAPDYYNALFGGTKDTGSTGGSSAPQSAPSANLGTPGEGVANAADGMVSVISPEGKAGKIPASKLGAALQRGFKRQ